MLLLDPTEFLFKGELMITFDGLLIDGTYKYKRPSLYQSYVIPCGIDIIKISYKDAKGISK